MIFKRNNIIDQVKKACFARGKTLEFYKKNYKTYETK